MNLGRPYLFSLAYLEMCVEQEAWRQIYLECTAFVRNYQIFKQAGLGR